MDPLKRKALTTELRALVAEIAADLLDQLRKDGPARVRAKLLHRDERVGDDFDVWLDLLSRRAAVLWVLKTVYVRVLEDRGFVKPIRLRDRESQVLFQHLAPGLADTAYLQWVFKDLASDGGLPELFAPQPAEVALPGKDVSKKLLDLWRRTDEATQELRYRFDDEHFDGRLMGDLYQDLDPVVKQRYALLQTPDFVVDFILDETLTPAINEFGPEAVRVLDPACGSGHFLIASFKRLIAAMRAKHPTRALKPIVQDVLARVVGIDLNDYACALARARLVMTALEATADTALALGSTFHPRVFWADGLEQLETERQGLIPGVAGLSPVRATLTRAEVKAALLPELNEGFTVLVANPPYITEKDRRQREYHRERSAGRRRYVSASGKYSLASPFIERMLQLGKPGAHIGAIVANTFMKRTFGRPLVEKVLSRAFLTKVVDTSGAYLPGHGTPTAILFARRAPPDSSPVTVVMGNRGEPGTPLDPRQGAVWSSISEHHNTVGYEDAFITVAGVSRATLLKHPWSIGGGGASDLKARIDGAGRFRLATAGTIGVAGMSNADEAFVASSRTLRRRGLSDRLVRPLVLGEDVRDWRRQPSLATFFPYDAALRLAQLDVASERVLWPYRTSLWARAVFDGGTYRTSGRAWYEWHQLTRDCYAATPALVFAFVSSHNQFAIERGGAVFPRTAPVIQIKPPENGPVLAAAAQLNCSIACFWMKQVFFNRGISTNREGARVTGEQCFDTYEFAATKLADLPLAVLRHGACEDFAASLDRAATERVVDSTAAVLGEASRLGAKSLRRALKDRRRRDENRLRQMVALQEELDWLCYRLFGVDPDAPENELRTPELLTPFRPGLRPFEITIAREDEECRGEVARGEERGEGSTAWFERHGWEPATTLEELPVSEREVVEARLARTGASRELSLLEQSTFKRRWYNPDYDAEEKDALETWLADRLEDWANERRQPFSVDDAASDLQADPAVLAVAEVLTGRPDFNLVELLAGLVTEESVPNQMHHVFKPPGLTKRAVWERTWEMQRAEDEAVKRGAKAPEPPVPPKYVSADYLRGTYWSLRGALDVPKERFIALTEVPGHTAEDQQLYAWAGLTHRERAKMLVELDEQSERAGVPREDRIGLLHGIQFLADYVAWESETAANEYRAAVTAVVGQAGVTEQMLAEWAARHPAPQVRRARARATRRTTHEEPEES